MLNIRNLFLPTQENNFQPLIVNSKGILLFAIIVFAMNFLLGSVSTTRGANTIDIQEVIDLHNEERNSAGLLPLQENTLLNRSAQMKADAMLRSNCWSHYCPEGKEPWEFFDEAGYIYVHAGENLGQGYYTEESVMRAWMNSPTHKENVLKSNFEEIGVGVAYGEFQNNKDNIVIAIHFGSRDYSNSVENVTITDTFDLTKPVINSPRDGDITNNVYEDIIGFAGESDEVEIINNRESVGKVNTEGGAFRYRPLSEYLEGKQEVEILSYRNGEYIDSSDKTTFYIDTTNPEIKDSTISAIGKVRGDDPKVLLEFESDESLLYAKIKTNDRSYNFTDVGSNTWQVDFPEKIILETSYFEIEIEDLANNQNLIGIDIGSIAGLSTDDNEIQINHSGNIFSAFSDNITDQNIKTQLNLLLVIFVVFVIAVDLYALKKTGMTGLDGKHHLHIGNFAVLIFVILIGGFGGVILNGISI